ncbi:MAG: signal peptide peptidase SppA [Candidatus Kryptonium sp.]|nr:signal peptide peptidase SppA [Candidatus Kryptonium sp.]MCX7762268.1 signal peptide peptidase SppA [Candidatus Kryptonium sp.]MDW8109345.1 signal peptide peptidase SppA [Candidatus Kryptonium sp.]
MSKEAKWFLGIIGIILSLSVLFFALGFFTLVSSMKPVPEDEVVEGKDKIALIELKGVIVSSEEIVRQIKKYTKSKAVKAIVFYIDSPGGGVSASEEIYQELKKAREKKPVIASMGSVAASGGYYVSLGATKIVANPGTITGSIGVIAQFPNLSKLFDKIGVDFEVVKSGKFKDSGNPYRGLTDEERKYLQNLIDDVYGQFVNHVVEERKMKKEDVLKIADGRVFTGKQAYELGLVDTLGTLEDAIKIAANMAGIKDEPKIVKERRKDRIFDILFESKTVESIEEIKNFILNQPVLQYRYEFILK